ncbi:nickel ABC transporter permease subunit NikC [Salmonella enterica subsp. enterica serovar Choleraesuis]|nr:nickel ABC transporter permease subunit NikC [Salmonella enterica subsp. enterica serovar Choleraesuis]
MTIHHLSWPVRIALTIIVMLALTAVIGLIWTPYDPQAIDLTHRLLSADGAHWLGTDHLGRDILSRLIAGTSLSLGSVFLCLVLVLAIGFTVGGAAGLIGGKTDQVLMRVAELFMTFPTLILSFFMVGVLGTGLTNVIIAIALSHWAWYARMVRSIILSLRQREYILAARMAGASKLRIFITHASGAVVPSLLVLASLDIGHMMLHVAGMSFLGLGVSAPAAEWGIMINDARQYIWSQPLQMVWPGLALFISVMAFNIAGDALRDRLDPALIAEHSH